MFLGTVGSNEELLLFGCKYLIYLNYQKIWFLEIFAEFLDMLDFLNFHENLKIYKKFSETHHYFWWLYQHQFSIPITRGLWQCFLFLPLRTQCSIHEKFDKNSRKWIHIYYSKMCDTMSKWILIDLYILIDFRFLLNRKF